MYTTLSINILTYTSYNVYVFYVYIYRRNIIVTQLLSLLKSQIRNHPAALIGHPSKYYMEEILDALSTQPEGSRWSRDEVVGLWPLVEESIIGEDYRIKKYYVTSNQSTCLMFKWEPIIQPDSNNTIYSPECNSNTTSVKYIHPDMPKNPIYAKTGLSYD